MDEFENSGSSDPVEDSGEAPRRAESDSQRLARRDDDPSRPVRGDRAEASPGRSSKGSGKRRGKGQKGGQFQEGVASGSLSLSSSTTQRRAEPCACPPSCQSPKLCLAPCAAPLSVAHLSEHLVRARREIHTRLCTRRRGQELLELRCLAPWGRGPMPRLTGYRCLGHSDRN